MPIYHFIHGLFAQMPYLAIFISLAIGYGIGSIPFGNFKLGGVAGSLIAGVFVSLLGVNIDDTVKSFLFAIFIYAVGYESGPEFFRSLGKRTINEIILALSVAVFSFGCVMGVAKLFHFDKGLAAGVASGGLTQSAIMGVSSDALAKLGLKASELKTMTANIGVGYAVTYIIGSLGAIVVCVLILPKFMHKDLRTAAIEEQAKSKGKFALDAGRSYALHRLVGRVYRVMSDNPGKISDVEKLPLTVEKVKRGSKYPSINPNFKLKKGDLLLLVGDCDAIIPEAENWGFELTTNSDMNIVMKTQEVVVTKKETEKLTLSDITEKVNGQIAHGIYLLSATRSDGALDNNSDTDLRDGDILKIYGSESDVDKAVRMIGKPITPGIMTDLAVSSLGIVVGLMIGWLTLKIGDVPLTLGSGGGVLLSGLLFGWFKARRPQFGGSVPTPVLQYMKDIGLAGFVTVVGLDSGLQAFITIKEQGISIVIAGLIVTFVPMLIAMVIGKYLLKYDNASLFAGALAGARSANPAFGEVLSQSGNAVPTAPFAVTYALANVFLTLLGPLVVAFV
jgi:aspartate-alanine antiporter